MQKPTNVPNPLSIAASRATGQAPTRSLETGASGQPRDRSTDYAPLVARGPFIDSRHFEPLVADAGRIAGIVAVIAAFMLLPGCSGEAQSASAVLGALMLLGLATLCVVLYRSLRATAPVNERRLGSALLVAAFALLVALAVWLLLPEAPKGVPGGDDVHEGR